MDVVSYVDALNEYPLAPGLKWLDEQIDKRGDVKLFKANNPNAKLKHGYQLEPMMPV